MPKAWEPDAPSRDGKLELTDTLRCECAGEGIPGWPTACSSSSPGLCVYSS